MEDQAGDFLKQLAAKLELVLFYRVCRAYWTGEIPTQSHVRLGVFFRKSPNPSRRQSVNCHKILAVDKTFAALLSHFCAFLFSFI